MSTIHHLPPAAIDPPGDVPPLVAGERLSRAEFERRFDAMTNLKKAELLEGVVYLPSPVRFAHHGRPHAMMIGWLFHYQALTRHVQTLADSTIRLDDANEPQPDAGLFFDSAVGGQVRVSTDDYLEGAPELVVEVAASSAGIDLAVKLPVYRRHRVREYLVWRVTESAFDWFVLRGTEFERLLPSPRGYYESNVFPGLWLDPAALDRCNAMRLLQTLQIGLESAEHAAFVTALEQRTGSDPRNPESA